MQSHSHQTPLSMCLQTPCCQTTATTLVNKNNEFFPFTFGHNSHFNYYAKLCYPLAGLSKRTLNLAQDWYNPTNGNKMTIILLLEILAVACNLIKSHSRY